MTLAIVVVEPLSSGELFKKIIREKGYEVIAVYPHSSHHYLHEWKYDEYRLLEYCNEAIFSSELCEIIDKIKATQWEIKAVFAASEGGVEIADRLSHYYKVPNNPMGFSKPLRDKGQMRIKLKKSSLRCPDFALCKTVKEIAHFADTHQYPLMVKTPKGAGSHKIYECVDKEQVIKAFNEIYGEKNVYGEVVDEVVIEEYILGKEYIVDTFSDGAKVHITDMWYYDKISTDHHKNIYYNIVSLPLDDENLKSIQEYAIKVVDAFDIAIGPAHLEIKDDPQRGPVLIEIGARLPGAMACDCVKKYTNFDPYEATLDVFIHGKVFIPSPIVQKKHYAIVLCPSLAKGTVKKIMGVEQVEKLTSFVSKKVQAKVGDKIGVSVDLWKIPFVSYLAHESRDQLMNDIERTHELFQISM